MNDYRTTEQVISRPSDEVDQGLRTHMARVYGIMGAGLAVSGLVAYFVGMNEALLATLFTGFTRYVVMFLPLVMVFAFGAAVSRLSYTGARLFFLAFAAAMGLSIAWIFAIYTQASIAMTFASTSVAFLGLSLWGYTTKRDISAWGGFLMMGVIGLIVASIVNLFLGSGVVQWAISVAGVLIFAGLTAYDTQNIKNLYLQQRYASGQSEAGHLAVFGALQLYLDFVNLFMFLLQFLGSRE